MKLHYHVVGRENAALDFPRTVFNPVPIRTVLDALPEDELAVLSPLLRSRFPDGECNVWGVPYKAEAAFKNVRNGDVVLLVQSTGADGQVPALCQVSLAWPRQLPTVSMALWGAHRFPWVFFFTTEPLTLTWTQLHAELGYNNYRAPALLHPIRDDRLARWNGPEGFASYIRTRYARSGRIGGDDPQVTSYSVAEPRAPYGSTPVPIDPADPAALDLPPVLTAGRRRTEEVSRALSRSAAFRRIVLQQYQARCAVCSSGLATPNGLPEVEAAHIYPVRLDGSDDPRNGISLCRRHHWGFDAGWFSLTDDCRVIIAPNLPAVSEYDFIREFSGSRLAPTLDQRYVPHPLFLGAHRELHGFE